jgi:biliverdin reductase
VRQTNTWVLAYTDSPVKIGIVGTGYAAKKRAEALQTDERARLISVTGNSSERLDEFCQTYAVSAINSWQELVSQPDLDLVFICTVNREHGAIARAALEADKHVVVEYPLSFDPQEAAETIALAETKGKLLHVEHIELIGGVHQAIRHYLAEIGNVFYARYATISPQRPVARHWSYHRQTWGFPLVAALSRIHRLTDLFGRVATVNCQTRYWDAPEAGYFTACLSNAQLGFANGVVAEITYGKGEVFWQGYRHLEIHGDRGTLLFEGEKGTLIGGEEKTPVEVASRRGLFAKDTQMVLERLLENKPLYVEPQASLYALEVADAARQSAETGNKKSFEF